MIKHLTINTDKIKEETTLLLLSDLHKSKNKKNDKIEVLKKKLTSKTDDIDIIIIAGDIIDSPRDLNNKTFISDLIITLADLTKNKPTFIALGNHDMTIKSDGEKYLRSILEAVKNVHCLENGEVIDIKGISISGFIPTMKYYKKPTEEEFLKQYNLVEGKEFNSDKYNIFVTHDPTVLIEISKKQNKFIKDNTDLVVTGHMHNGLMPNILHKITFHRGLVGAYKTFFPKYAHGELKLKDTEVHILGAVNTLVKHPIINKIYSPNAEILTIKPKIKIKE